MKKFTLLVVRWSNQNNCFENSKPCQSCTSFLKLIGIGKIIYSTGNNDLFKIERVKNLNTNHISSGMKSLNREIKKSKKN